MKTPSRLELNALSPIEWVKEERSRQNAKWGQQDHNALKFMSILAEELGEVSKVLNHRTEFKMDHDDYLRELEYELIQVAAVAVQWVEAVRRGNGSEEDPGCPCDRCMRGEPS